MALLGVRLIRQCSHVIRRFQQTPVAATMGVNRFVQRRGYAIVDDDGDVTKFRTTVSILNQEQDQGIFIDSYSSLGFLLSTGIRVIGPCAVFPRSVLHWNVQNVNSINEDSLTLFTLLEPKIDILLIGVGERENLSKVSPDIYRFLKSHKINVEILATDQALATFNFLNAEKRYVAGAFIPPSYVDMYNTDELVDIHSAKLPTTHEHYMEDGDITKILPLDEKFKKELEDSNKKRKK